MTKPLLKLSSLMSLLLFWNMTQSWAGSHEEATHAVKQGLDAHRARTEGNRLIDEAVDEKRRAKQNETVARDMSKHFGTNHHLVKHHHGIANKLHESANKKRDNASNLLDKSAAFEHN